FLSRSRNCCFPVTVRVAPQQSNKRTQKRLLGGPSSAVVAPKSIRTAEKLLLGRRLDTLENYWPSLRFFAAERIKSVPVRTPLRCPAHRTRLLVPHLSQAASLRKGGSS